MTLPTPAVVAPIKVVRATPTTVELLIYERITLELVYDGKKLVEETRTVPGRDESTYIFPNTWSKLWSFAYAALRKSQRDEAQRKEKNTREPMFL